MAAANLLYYIASAIAAYTHHEPFKMDVAKTHRHLTISERRKDRAKATLKGAYILRTKRFDAVKEHAVWIHEEAERLRSVYWGQNLENRSDRQQSYPKVYSKKLDVEVVEELKHLCWKEADDKEVMPRTVPEGAHA